MCKAKPGPRCSTHAKEKVHKTKQIFLKAEKEKSIVEATYRDTQINPEDYTAKQISETQKLLAQKNQKLEQSHRKYKEALKEFYTTPAGFELLDFKIAEAKRIGDNQRATELKELKDKGVLVRKSQMEAYNEEKSEKKYRDAVAYLRSQIENTPETDSPDNNSYEKALVNIRSAIGSQPQIKEPTISQHLQTEAFIQQAMREASEYDDLDDDYNDEWVEDSSGDDEYNNALNLLRKKLGD